MKKHITNIPGPTEHPAHDQIQRIETEFQGKESTAGLIQGQGTFAQLKIITDHEQDHLQHQDACDMVINMTCHTPVTVGKAHHHPEPSIGRNLQRDHARDQHQEGVTVTRILKVFQKMFFTAKMAQDHDHDPVHITG